jgi:hypothetical protein
MRADALPVVFTFEWPLDTLRSVHGPPRFPSTLPGALRYRGSSYAEPEREGVCGNRCDECRPESAPALWFDPILEGVTVVKAFHENRLEYLREDQAEEQTLGA